MKKKTIKFLLVTIFLFISCENINKKEKKIDKTPFSSLKINNIGYIAVIEGGKKYEIKNKNEIRKVLSKLQNAYIEYIKFGSKNHFIIYNIKGEELIEASYKDNKYKIRGVVYHSKNNIFY